MEPIKGCYGSVSVDHAHALPSLIGTLRDVRLCLQCNHLIIHTLVTATVPLCRYGPSAVARQCILNLKSVFLSDRVRVERCTLELNFLFFI